MEQGDLSNLPQQPDLERTYQLNGYLRMYETEIKRRYSVFYDDDEHGEGLCTNRMYLNNACFYSLRLLMKL